MAKLRSKGQSRKSKLLAGYSEPSESWTSEERSWELRFRELESFWRRYGHVRVPRRYLPAPELPVWLAAQKTESARLSREQLWRLWEIGVRFPGAESRWLFQFFKLAKVWGESGDVNGPDVCQDDPPLQRWVYHQRSYQGRRLPGHRRRLLEEIGFVWGLPAVAWEECFAKVLAFKARFGHARIPPGWPENPRLAIWLANQRAIVKDPERRRRMEEAGCFICREELVWERRFQEWKNYVREHGRNSFSGGSEKKTPLAQWVAHLRMKKRAGELEPGKVRRLEEVGFLWNPKPEQWERHFRALEEFRKKHGHCRVGEMEGKSELSQWCWDQTRHHKLGEVSPERVARLEALGFVWNPRETFRQRMLEKLRRFHALHGHCHVPSGWGEEPRLQTWVHRQRQALKKGKLSQEQIRELAGLPI